MREDSFALSFVSWRLAGGDLPAWQAQLTRVLCMNTGGQFWLLARDVKKLEFLLDMGYKIDKLYVGNDIKSSSSQV